MCANKRGGALTGKTYSTCVFLLALMLDIATKHLAILFLVLASEKQDKGIPSLHLHFNQGISFSILKNAPWFGLAIALLGIFLLSFLCIKSKTARALPGITLLWAGSIGNLIDRLAHGHVIDWIYVGIYINLADIWIITGAFLSINAIYQKQRRIQQ